HTKYETPPPTTSAKMTTVDSLNLQSLRLLKADVEGMEVEVLKGAKQTIEKFRPILYVECDRADKSPILVDTIRHLKYNIYFHIPYLFNPNNFLRNDFNY